MYQVVEAAAPREAGTVGNLDIHLEEEADRLLRGNQKLAPFLLAKESCLQREKEKG
jgi:hypothetical protein